MRASHPTNAELPAESSRCSAQAVKRAERTYQGVTIVVMLWLLASLWWFR
jgi:hypothetical protein